MDVIPIIRGGKTEYESEHGGEKDEDVPNLEEDEYAHDDDGTRGPFGVVLECVGRLQFGHLAHAGPRKDDILVRILTIRRRQQFFVQPLEEFHIGTLPQMNGRSGKITPQIQYPQILISPIDHTLPYQLQQYAVDLSPIQFHTSPAPGQIPIHGKESRHDAIERCAFPLAGGILITRAGEAGEVKYARFELSHIAKGGGRKDVGGIVRRPSGGGVEDVESPSLAGELGLFGGGGGGGILLEKPPRLGRSRRRRRRTVLHGAALPVDKIVHLRLLTLSGHLETAIESRLGGIDIEIRFEIEIDVDGPAGRLESSPGE
mmetsp:Transcript_21726/g.63954  ORF Transcript_21726/g.63954 Transcript_21726/m.63954 type:complete len:316 (-) Transcript_21726:1113-2060(-)